MSEEIEDTYANIRANIALAIHDAIAEAPGVLKVFKPEAAVGPLGGKKYQFLVAVEDENEDVFAAMVVVYSDHNIEDRLDEVIEEQKRKKERRNFVKGE